jgi:hypothetical protein
MAMALGVAAGYAFPNLPTALNSLSVGTTSIPIAIGLIWMMYPPLARVRYEDLGKIVREEGSKTMLSTSLVLNWLVGPLLIPGGGALRAVDLEDPMHAYQLEKRSDLFRQGTELQVTALGAQLPQAGEHGAQSRTVHKAQLAQVEYQFGVRLQYGCYVALELTAIARIQFIHRHCCNSHAVQLVHRDFH